MSLRQVDPANRVIFLGLGGLGVQTLDRIKKLLAREFTSQWQSQVTLVAVDKDRTELERATKLEGAEKITAGYPGANQRLRQPREQWPHEWRMLIPEEEIPGMPDLDHPGTLGHRLVGKMSLYDRPSQNQRSAEEKIRHALAEAANRMLPLHLGAPEYHVYVIAGSSGGFGGGAVTEIPALVCRGLAGRPFRIHGVVYLPELMPVLGDVTLRRANGCATLKELDHFQRKVRIPGSRLRFPGGDSPLGTVELARFYDQIRLVGNRDGLAGQLELAMDTVVQGLLDELTRGINLPLGGPNGYSAVGFARLGLPKGQTEGILKGMILEQERMLPVSKEDWERNRGMDGNGPFLERETALPPQMLEQMVREMMEPLEKTVEELFSGKKFSYLKEMELETDQDVVKLWREIREGNGEHTGVRRMVDRHIQKETNPAAMARMEKALRRGVEDALELAQAWTERIGPWVLAQAYRGQAGEDGIRTEGIRDRLDCLERRILERQAGPVEQRRRELDQKTRELCQQNGVMILLMQQQRHGAAMAWVQRYDWWVDAIVEERRCGVLLGRGGMVDRLVRWPLEKLARRSMELAGILEEENEEFRSLRDRRSTWDQFRQLRDGPTQWNPAWLGPEIYDIVMECLGQMTRGAGAERLRSRLAQTVCRMPAPGADPREWTPEWSWEQFSVQCDELIPRNLMETLSEQVQQELERRPQVLDGVIRRAAAMLQQEARPMITLSHGLNPPQGGQLVIPLDLANQHGGACAQLELEVQNLNGTLTNAYGLGEEIAVARQIHGFALGDLEGMEHWQEVHRMVCSHPGWGLHGLNPPVGELLAE